MNCEKKGCKEWRYAGPTATMPGLCRKHYAQHMRRKESSDRAMNFLNNAFARIMKKK